MAWRGVMRYGTVEHRKVTPPHRMVLHAVVQHGKARYGTVRYVTVRCGNTVWYGMVSPRPVRVFVFVCFCLFVFDRF